MVSLVLLACALAAGEEGPAPEPAYPLWDGKESQADYARRTGLEPTLTLDCGNGVKMELVLIPAGKFIMGTPEPELVDDYAFARKLWASQAAVALGAGVLAVLVASIFIQAFRKRRQPQSSLRRLLMMTFFVSVAVLGGTGWWDTARQWDRVRKEYVAAKARSVEASSWEKPAHEVTISRPFYMGKYEVTQEQYVSVIGKNPSQANKGAHYPVETVLWEEAEEFCRLVGSQNTKWKVRLPTETEWEYACRSGTKTRFYSGDADGDLEAIAWYFRLDDLTNHPVGQKTANAWGLHDMLGNVQEWVEDDWHSDYRDAPADGRAWYGARNPIRVLRGGSWIHKESDCRSTCRLMSAPGYCNGDLGFRVAVDLE